MVLNNWQTRFAKFMELIRKQGFFACEVDPIVFPKTTSIGYVILVVYLDDMLIMGNDLSSINHVKAFL